MYFEKVYNLGHRIFSNNFCNILYRLKKFKNKKLKKGKSKKGLNWLFSSILKKLKNKKAKKWF